MLISTRGRYALRVMADLASHPSEGFVSLRAVSERQDISEKYMEAVIKQLVKAGLLAGMRGKGGGYKLTRPPEEYTVGDILRLTELALVPVACMKPKALPCPRAADCPTLPVWEGLDKVIGEYLDGITLADLLVQQAGEEGAKQ